MNTIKKCGNLGANTENMKVIPAVKFDSLK